MKVELINWTALPIETVVTVWWNSRNKEQISNPAHLCNHMTDDEINGEFRKIVKMDLPITEMVSFTFNFMDIPVSLREQLVRHRNGVYWSQTSRTKDLANFDYFVPPEIEERPDAKSVYENAIENIKISYKILTDIGVHYQDARQILPQAYTHDIVVHFSLRTLYKIVGSRICEIAQSNLWMPVIEGMKEKMIEINPELGCIFKPPCIDIDGNYIGCHLTLENENRVAGIDPFEPCSIYVENEVL